MGRFLLCNFRLSNTNLLLRNNSLLFPNTNLLLPGRKTPILHYCILLLMFERVVERRLDSNSYIIY